MNTDNEFYDDEEYYNENDSSDYDDMLFLRTTVNVNSDYEEYKE